MATTVVNSMFGVIQTHFSMLFLPSRSYLHLQVIVELPVVLARTRYSVSLIYSGRVYRGIGYIAVACWTPCFLPTDLRILQTWRPRARYFSRNRGNSLHSIRGRLFFAKSAHHDSLCSCSLETIFHEINSSLPVNAGWNTCCASIVSQSRVQLIQCQCKSRLQTANLGINSAFNQIVAVWPRCLHPPSCPSLRQFRSKSSVRD